MTSGTPIMPTTSNNKISDKAFVKQYGQTTTFSYGCASKPFHDSTNNKDIPQSDIYVYRITMTTPDGNIIEYTPSYMRYRCEQMGVKSVPLLWKGIIPPVNSDGLIQSDDFIADENGEFKEWIFKTPGEYIKDIAEQYYDGPDPIGKSHIREGVVIRLIEKPKFCAYKHKNLNFKILEGIIKNEAIEPDMEEAQDLLDKDN